MDVGVSREVTLCVGVCEDVEVTLALDDAVLVIEGVCDLDRVCEAVGDWLGLVVSEAEALCVAD